MVYADIEKRRQAAKRRYWSAKGVSLSENNGNGDSASESLPRFVPEGRTILDFQPKGHKRTLASAQNWIRDHPTITGVIIPLSIGVGIGFFGILFSYKYLVQLPGQVKAFLSPYLPASNRQQEPVKSSLDKLLDFGQSVIDRSGSYS